MKTHRQLVCQAADAILEKEGDSDGLTLFYMLVYPKPSVKEGVINAINKWTAIEGDGGIYAIY